MTLSDLKPFSKLPWESRFVDRFPGDPESANFTRQVPGACYSQVTPTPVAHPQLLGWSNRLASQLGIERPEPDSDSLRLLSGNQVLPSMKSYSARYGGHQFGHWAGQLGDGRAITLGEVQTPKGRFEFQLKGAGPTPYSRRADGRAVLRSSIREFLCSEAMHFLGVPTTRALSLVTTGDAVVRDLFYNGNPAEEPGAIVCRVAPSFLRFGNFEILTLNPEIPLLKKLTRFLIEDHFPELSPGDPDVYGKLLDEICRRTAMTVAHWIRVGFVHGVMNTDNMSALGLTIDYGPYGWLEPYDPDWTPNTTDSERRRYRFGNQPSIALWNLTRLGEALYPLIQNEDRVLESLSLYREKFEEISIQMMSEKLGLTALQLREDQKMVQDLFSLLQARETDYTLFFRGLSNWNSREESFIDMISSTFHSPESLSTDLREKWNHWSQNYSNRTQQSEIPEVERQARMKKVNPKYVLRNYLAQNAITAATQGDLSVMNRLMRVLETPYDEHPLDEDLGAKRPEWARNAPGCSMLSCSS